MQVTKAISPGSAAFFQALREVRTDLRLAQDFWWIIGSAAMAIHGVEGLGIGDIDILMQPDDARHVLAAKGTAPIRENGTSRFRSDVYGA